ncbi:MULTISPECIES: penicillin-binding transpeptidase domain-containing protein [Arthrobacter]|uniref:Penicillin-binding transpeptidase domain-containing protein n=2 Tax=Arthrobacter TaxID=1663 RepID=A0ABU9KKF8_9MICC|nr:penicillin-binding transpeptidase domain-containing protein [Arthrobacter sp. YJM1]MDP5226929.1 penicillin-binding transpeptidase domain-containing protein [Arthrobacter sp. YJM1]
MNQAIRNAWIATVVLFALLFGAVSYIQVIGARDLNTNPLNTLALTRSLCNDRGTILAGGQPIAESVAGNEACKSKRSYPDGAVYAGITGYYSTNGSQGSTGMERSMNSELTGASDQQFLDRVRQLFLGKQPQGANVETTLDPKIQKLAYGLIPDGVQGYIVVQNPKTGAILAMVSKPSYDPNTVATLDRSAAAAAKAQLDGTQGINLYQNVSGPTGALLSPGSVFKLVDTAAALESGKYNKDSVLPNPAQMSFPGIDYKLPNYAGGQCYTQTQASFAFALANSCNTPFAGIALDLGENKIADKAKAFGIGQDPGDQLHLDYGKGKFPTGLNQPQLAQSAIGQFDVLVTPLQISMLTSAIANGGVQMKPELVKTLRAPDLRVITEYQPEALRTATTPAVAQQINDWMVGVVDNGLAAGAAVPGVKVAAKTGTAELGNGLNNSWFTGFAPADNPQVVVTIAIHGVDVATGAQLTSPNAKKLFEAVLNK